MNYKGCCYVVCAAIFLAGPSYAVKTLWGDIDAPESLPKAEMQGQLMQPVAPAASTTQPAAKTTCDVIRAQISLDPLVMQSADVLNMLRNYSQAVAPEYKALVTDTGSLNELYTLYRQSYIKKYCARS